MELPNLGRRCENPTCKQLDFLPILCSKCKSVFCSEHFNEHVPKCQEPNLNTSVKTKLTNLFICSEPDCEETSLVPLICEKCHKHFCIAHRHINECVKEDPAVKAAAIAKMNEPVLTFEKAKADVNNMIDETLSKAKKKVKNAETAKLVQLMRVKNRAVGLKSIPSADRIYFNVYHPKSYGDKATPVFISNSWSIGRAIDFVADECKVKNENNKSDASKLRLFDHDTEELISGSMSDKLLDLLNANVLFNGQSLNLEYTN